MASKRLKEWNTTSYDMPDAEKRTNEMGVHDFTWSERVIVRRAAIRASSTNPQAQWSHQANIEVIRLGTSEVIFGFGYKYTGANRPALWEFFEGQEIEIHEAFRMRCYTRDTSDTVKFDLKWRYARDE